MADAGHFRIGLCLVGDKATMATPVDFHCGAPKDSELACTFSQSRAGNQCPPLANNRDHDHSIARCETSGISATRRILFYRRSAFSSSNNVLISVMTKLGSRKSRL